MKKFAALLVAMLLLLSVSAAVAEDQVVTLYTAENGASVTLTLKEGCTLSEKKTTDNGETAFWTASREGAADVIILIAPCEEVVSLNDLTDEELADIIAMYGEEYGDVVTVSVEVTPAGNKYFDCFWDEYGAQMHERWTYFEGFELSRIQFSENEVLTDADTAFMAEIQEGMWVKQPEKAE